MEKKLLKQAIESFKENFGFQMEIEDFQHHNSELRIDAVLKMTIQQMELKFYAEIKSTVNSSLIGILMHHKNDFPHAQLLVSNYINPLMAEKLKENDINFIDVAGNAYINAHPVFIFVKGNKPRKSLVAPSKGKAFTQSGLKMIYALLCDEILLNRSYREIASASNIALGTVGQVIENLKELGFIIDMGARGKKLTNNDVLFNRWCMDYTEKLKPKLLLGRFEGPDDFWMHCLLEPDQGQWSGEVAAFKLTNYLRPQNVILYVREENLKNILLRNRLKKKENGNIEIYKKFWSNSGKQDESIAHPFIIYADLMEINNQRTIETAKVIYDQNIAGYFRKS
jgi:hypothetical protein